MSSNPALVVPVLPGSSLSSESAKRAPSGLGDALSQQWKQSGAKDRKGEARVFYNVADHVVSALGVGKEPESENAKREASRVLAARGVLSLTSLEPSSIAVDPLYSSHAAAEGAVLSLHHWSLKTNAATKTKAKERSVEVKQLGDAADARTESEGSGKGVELGWETGKVYAQAQNLAKELMDTPANKMTPTMFSERVKKEFEGLKNVTVNVHDKAWAESHKMGSFLSVAAGTDEPCKFVEIIYNGAGGKGKKLAYVGKGITFDSGGISLKPGAGMKEMRADMGGAAVVVSSAWAIAKLELPVDLVVCTPLTENMPSGKATKPGDIVTAMNGKTIEIDNTDAEGRLVLADALYYASSTYKPDTIINVATLTGAMMIALGEVYTGAFVSDDTLWSELEEAGKAESDEFWRMPLHDQYLKQIDYTGADLCNTGGRQAGSCTAAIFLREFVDGLTPAANATEEEAEASGKSKEKPRWAHLDIAGVMSLTHPRPYEQKGMSGRATRPLIELARRRAGKSA